MKTAIILFKYPTDDSNYFLKACYDKATKDGFTVLHSSEFDDYRKIDMKAFIERISQAVDAVYLFIDNGISDIMTDVIRKFYYRDESGFIFSKEIRIEAVWSYKSKTLASILKYVSEKVEIPVEILKMKTRKREIVEARQFFFVEAKEQTKESLSRIGAYVGKDHATVLHGIKTVNNTVEVKEKYEELFKGKISERKLRMLNNSPHELKGMLIGKNPLQEKVVNMVSPYADIQSGIREYSGYRQHAM